MLAWLTPPALLAPGWLLSHSLTNAQHALSACAHTQVEDLPSRRDFDAGSVWSRYADGKPYLAPTPHEESAACVLRKCDDLITPAAKACGLSEEEADMALRQVCAALAAGEVASMDEVADGGAARDVACYLANEGLVAPRDLGLIPAEAIRSLADSLVSRSS